MTGTFLVRGMLVGIVAGLLAFGFGKLFGKPRIDRAIAFEEQMDKAKEVEAKPPSDQAKAQAEEMKGMDMSKDMVMSKAEAAEPELVSRAVQSSVGLSDRRRCLQHGLRRPVRARLRFRLRTRWKSGAACYFRAAGWPRVSSPSCSCRC